MKVGTSLSRCVVDIFEKRVDMDEVMVIVSRTRLDPDDDVQWKSIWGGYTPGGWSNPEWAMHTTHETEFRDICKELQSQGKLHQPRLFGAHPTRSYNPWYELTVAKSDMDQNPALQSAWDQYQIIAGLSK